MMEVEDKVKLDTLEHGMLFGLFLYSHYFFYVLAFV